jgi:hypothetical protein
MGEYLLTVKQPGGQVTTECVSDAKIHAYLALAHAARLDRETAVRYFRLAEPRMKALRQVELLSRCQKALGLPVEPIAHQPNSANPYQSPVTD